jgi:hypothetical protein
MGWKGLEEAGTFCATIINLSYGQNLVASTGKHDDRSTRISALGRKDRHCRLRDIFNLNLGLAGNQWVLHRFHILWSSGRLRIRNQIWPYRHLRMSRRWLPARRLGAQIARPKQHSTESKNQRLHHNPSVSFQNVFKQAGGCYVVLCCRGNIG